MLLPKRAKVATNQKLHYFLGVRWCSLSQNTRQTPYKVVFGATQGKFAKSLPQLQICSGSFHGGVLLGVWSCFLDFRRGNLMYLPQRAKVATIPKVAVLLRHSLVLALAEHLVGQKLYEF